MKKAKKTAKRAARADLRSPMAKARDRYFETEGRDLDNATSLGAPSRNSTYLRNRLERAFIAGYLAGSKDARVRVTEVGK